MPVCQNCSREIPGDMNCCPFCGQAVQAATQDAENGIQSGEVKTPVCSFRVALYLIDNNRIIFVNNRAGVRFIIESSMTKKPPTEIRWL